MEQSWQDQELQEDHQPETEEPVYQVLQTAPFIGQDGISPAESPEVMEVLFSPTEVQTQTDEAFTPTQPTRNRAKSFALSSNHPKTGKERFSCQLCSESYDVESHLLQHLQSHCDAKTGNDSSGMSRPALTTGREKFCCEVCGKTYTTSSNLFKHARTHSGVKHKCSSCPKSFRYKETLKRHKETHSRRAGIHKRTNIPIVFECPYCQEVLPSKLRLGIHLRTHPFEKPYKCDVCSRTFSQRTGCIRHRLSHSTNRPRVCSLCGQGFASKDSLRTHVKTHSNRRPFPCSKCGKAFAVKQTLVEHKKIHTDVKTYGCQYCGKRFHQRSTLWGHVKIHKRKQVSKCKTCSECFSTAQDLAKHEKKHWLEQDMHREVGGAKSGKKNSQRKHFTCEECGETFAQKSVLQTHMRRHSGEMPFKCEQCGRRFRHLASHRRHLMTHTGIKPFKCDSCHRTFTKKSYLDGHLTKCCTESDNHLQQIALSSPEENELFNVAKSKSDSRSLRTNTASLNDKIESGNTLPGLPSGQEEESESSGQSDDSQIDSDENCQGLNCQSTSPQELEGNETSVDSDSAFADRMIVSFEDVFDVPINEECVQTVNLLDHVMQLTQIVQEHVDNAQDSIEDPEEQDSTAPKVIDRNQQKEEPTEGECPSIDQKEDSKLDKNSDASGKCLVCELCGRMYRTRSSLLRHRQAHTFPKPHTCDICNKSYSRKPLLIEHKQFAHHEQSEQTKIHTCGHCNQAFPNANRLALHVRVHTGEKPFKCIKCDKAFADRSNYLRHERTHKGFKSHSCMHCDVTFVEKSALKRHLKRHEGTTSFPCQVCSKKFASKPDLQCHSYVHMPAQEPECHLCGLKFQQEVRFRQHKAESKRVEKRCRICKDGFTSDCIRRQHELKEHKFLLTDSGFSCGICNVDFNKRSRAIGHIRNHCSFTKRKKEASQQVQI